MLMPAATPLEVVSACCCSRCEDYTSVSRHFACVGVGNAKHFWFASFFVGPCRDALQF